MSAPISIRIDKDGNVHFDVHGVSGPPCEKLTEALVRATGQEAEKTLNEEYALERPDYIQNFNE